MKPVRTLILARDIPTLPHQMHNRNGVTYRAHRHLKGGNPQKAASAVVAYGDRQSKILQSQNAGVKVKALL